jgi:hypothetical protein
MIKTCKYCNKEIEVEKPKSFGAHVRNCKSNPNLESINNKSSISRKKAIEKKSTCPKCNKEFRGCTIIKHIPVCGKKQIKENDLDKFIEKKSDNVFSCLICKEEFNKFGIYSHVYMKHVSDKKIHYSEEVKAKMGWHKGLNKNTDERLKKKADKSKEDYATGKKIANFKGQKHSIKTRELLSIKQSQRIEEKGENSTLKHFKHVKFYKIKNILGEEYNVRGTYELKLADWLNNKNILWKRKIYLKYIKDDVKRTYAPDFYIPEINDYFETKGYFSKEDKEKMNLVNQQNKINVNMIFKKQIKELEKINSLKELLEKSEHL